MPHVVAALAPPVVSPLELSVACEVFGGAGPEAADDWYELRVCAAGSRASTSLGGLTVATPWGLDGLAGAATVIALPGPGAGPPPAGDDLLAALRAAHERGARVASFCTAAFLLARAGLLDGRRAATHWAAAARLAAEHPRVRVDPRVLYVDEGDVLTSAGAAASIDLALHLVRHDHGAEMANAVARSLVVPPHRDGGQAQYVDAPVAPVAGPDPFREALTFALDHLGDPLAVRDLARRACMSERSFARRFRAVTGTTPHQWLLGQRVLLARRLLETTELPVERVAQECGFGGAVTLRAHFQRLLGTSPLAYRRTFRGDGPRPGAPARPAG